MNIMNALKKDIPKRRTNEGSVLITAIIFTTILSVIAIPTYLKLSNAALREANRAFYNMAAVNLAESGLEHGVQALREATTGNSKWDGWYEENGGIRKSLDAIVYEGGITGHVNVYISNYTSDNPEIVTKTVITLPHGPPIVRYMYADFSGSSTRGLFAYGMLTKNFIEASGAVEFSSWESDPDLDPDTPFVPFSNAVSKDNASIATTGTADGAIDLGSSRVYGTAAVGSASQKGLDVSWSGQVGPRDPNEWDTFDTEMLWAKDPPGWKVSTKTGALTTNFSATFEEIVAPAVELTELWTDYHLPYTERVERSNQWTSWYDNVYVDEETIGAPGEVTILELDDLTVRGASTLTIQGDVTIVFPEENTTSFTVMEGGAIELDDDASLVIYTAGNMEVTGAGIFSEVAPKQLQIWGTATESQTIDFINNAQFSGLIYAPNADVTVTGDADFFGSIVSKSIILANGGHFRFDESLKNYTGSGSSSGPVNVRYVEELVGEERTAYIDLLDF